VVVRLAKGGRERRRVLAFVRRHVRRLYGGIPPPSQILFFTERNHRICGTIALDFAEGSERLPLESIYQIYTAQTPWKFDRGKIAQFSKWWATEPGVAVHLMQTAHLYALREGKRFGLAEAKPPILAKVEELGMALVEIPGATLLIQGISLRGEGYYAEPPPPCLYMFDISTNAAALERLRIKRRQVK